MAGSGKQTGKNAAQKDREKAPARPSRAKKTPANGGAKRANGGSAPAKKRQPVAAAVGVTEHGFEHQPVDQAASSKSSAVKGLNEFESRLLGDLFAVIEEHSGEHAPAIDRSLVESSFLFACDHHADQRRRSGEGFIVHPVGVAKICAGLRLDTATLCAALLHDTVEDTSASLEEVKEEFDEEIATLVDGVTKLTGITFQSRDDRQAENYRKMIVAMAADVRVILIKLADRLHNMRTLESMPKQKQQEKAKETLEIFAPLAHRLGIHAIKWELEDL
ncbi:MAG: HD domain-containing protein, partial [Thermoleophilaceae bacterium]